MEMFVLKSEKDGRQIDVSKEMLDRMPVKDGVYEGEFKILDGGASVPDEVIDKINKPTVTPAAEKLLFEFGVTDFSKIVGSGANGSITLNDAKAHVESLDGQDGD
jgi:hypothetical protein